MADLWKRLREFHESLERGRRIQLYVALALSLAAIVATGVWSSQTSWVSLLDGRSYDQLLDGAAALEAQDIPYKLDGTTLYVPSARIGAGRAAVAESTNLPGLSDVADLQLGLTPTAQTWAFLRAREGDIARMVNGIVGVAASQVNIVPGRQGLFQDDDVPARAAVFLRLRPGHTLTEGQVGAVVNLVASAADGLAADHVSVVDDSGHLLAEGRGAGAPGAATDEAMALLSYREKVEQRYERAVHQALGPLLGYDGAFSVTATVDLDPTSSQRTSRTVDGEAQALLSEQIEESTSEETAPEGVPGVDANLPERAAPPANGAAKTEQMASTSNYVYPTVDEVERRPPGAISRLSVAVQVDAGRLAALAEAASVAPEELQSRIQESVRAAVGFDAERADQIAVQFVPFVEREWVEGTAAAIGGAELAREAAPWAIALLALLMTFFGVVRPLVAAATRVEPPEAAVEEEEEDEHIDDAILAARLRDLVDNFQPVDAQDLNRLVGNQSTAAAQVLRRWQSAASE